MDLREWWSAAATGPELLMLIRMGVATIFLLAVIMAAWAVAWPAEREGTWDAAQYRRARFMNAWRLLGLLMLVGYLVIAGVLEQDRTSSPHRLIVANIGQFTIGSWQLFDMIFWRWHYARKPEVLREKGIMVNPKKGAA